MILAGLALGWAGPAAADTADWYQSPGEGKWNYRQKLTINHTNLLTDLTNFPMLVNLTTNIWKSADNGGHVRQSNGWDILFTASDGRTKLNHEIEKYTPTNGELVAWINLPALSSNVDTEIYIYYSNGSCSSQWNANAVWDANYMMVQHLGESPTNGAAGHIDSTTNANNGTPYGFSNATNSTTNPERDVPDWDTKKKIDGADVFKGTNDYINCGNGASLALTNNFTAEMWVKSEGAASQQTWINHYTDANNYFHLFRTATQIMLETKQGGVISRNIIWVIPTPGQWYHITVTYDGTHSEVWLNGIYQSPYYMASGYTAPTGGRMVIGMRSDNKLHFNGAMDEIRISDMVRGEGWIKAGAVNQASPGAGGFLKSIGDEEYRVKKGTIFSTY